jgi:chromosome segregation ATPase
MRLITLPAAALALVLLAGTTGMVAAAPKAAPGVQTFADDRTAELGKQVAELKKGNEELSKKMSEVEKDVVSLRKDKDESLKKHSEAEKALTAEITQRESLAKRVTETEKDIVALEKEQVEQAKKLTNYEKDAESARKLAKEMGEDLEDAQDEIVILKKAREEMAKKQVELEKEADAITKTATERGKVQDKLAETVEDMGEDAEKRSKRLTNLETGAKVLAKLEEDSAKDVSELEKEVANLKEEVAALKKEKEATAKKLADLEKRLAKLEKGGSLADIKATKNFDEAMAQLEISEAEKEAVRDAVLKCKKAQVETLEVPTKDKRILAEELIDAFIKAQGDPEKAQEDLQKLFIFMTTEKVPGDEKNRTYVQVIEEHKKVMRTSIQKILSPADQQRLTACHADWAELELGDDDPFGKLYVARMSKQKGK